MHRPYLQCKKATWVPVFEPMILYKEFLYKSVLWLLFLKNTIENRYLKDE